MTEILRAFWKEKRPERIAVLVSGILFAVIFWIYKIPVEIAGYAFLLVILWNVIWFTLVFIRYEKRQRILEENQGKIRTEAGGFPEAESRESEMYQELIRQLYEEKKELESSVQIEKQELSDYYSMWVHQIKTPISSMRLTLQNEDSLLARKLSCDLSHIEQYVEMVLAFLRLDSNSSDYVFKMHELDPLLRQSIRRFSSEFINRKLSLSYTPPSDESGTLQMITDDKWFCFVIEQLLSNALKYTRTGTISIFFSQPKVLCIKDTGIGIAPQDLPRVFEKGYTGCNGRTDKKASGLGLYLCKRICKNLGIGISITSEIGDGTCVYLSLDQYPLRAE